MNEALVRATMSHIRENAKQWVQSDFVRHDRYCGTRHCFAGWALRLSGLGVVHGRFVAPRGMELSDNLFTSRQARTVYTVQTAQHLLGFTEEQVTAVFFAFQQTDVDEFARAVERVTGLSGL